LFPSDPKIQERFLTTLIAPPTPLELQLIDFTKNNEVVQMIGTLNYQMLQLSNRTWFHLGSCPAGLGLVGPSNQTVFNQIAPADSFLNYQQISISNTSHALAITERGDLYSWGKSTNGEIGHQVNWGQVNSETKLVSNLKGEKIKFVSAANYLSFVVTLENEVYCFGQVKGKKPSIYPVRLNWGILWNKQQKPFLQQQQQ